MIRVKRTTRWPDMSRAYKIQLDGEPVGEIRWGEDLELDVPEGKHELRASIDWCRTPPIEFVSDGSDVEFECGSGVRGWRLLLVLLYISILRSQYLNLRKV